MPDNKSRAWRNQLQLTVILNKKQQTHTHIANYLIITDFGEESLALFFVSAWWPARLCKAICYGLKDPSERDIIAGNRGVRLLIVHSGENPPASASKFSLYPQISPWHWSDRRIRTILAWLRKPGRCIPCTIDKIRGGRLVGLNQ